MSEKKFCSNCDHHNPFNYPNQILCTIRFLKNEKPVVSALWCCEEWKPTQKCYCIEEALKKRKRK